jgi:hypothetical protein
MLFSGEGCLDPWTIHAFCTNLRSPFAAVVLNDEIDNVGRKSPQTTR